LKKYFFRGYFDGDGSIYKYEKYYQVGLNITSTYEQDWGFIVDLFNELNIKPKIKRTKYKNKDNKTYNMSRVIIYNKIDIIKFCEYIYQNYDFMGLKRKYEIYEKINN
jgi:intein/homing endonuclease